jgi:hypothetical protein
MYRAVFLRHGIAARLLKIVAESMYLYRSYVINPNMNILKHKIV